MRATRHRRKLLAMQVLVACALLLRGLVPLGYMPAKIDGHLGIVFCTEHGPDTELGHHEELPAGYEHGGAPCYFGFAVSMAAAPAVPVGAPPAPGPERTRPEHGIVTPPAIVVAAHRARGPPSPLI